MSNEERINEGDDFQDALDDATEFGNTPAEELNVEDDAQGSNDVTTSPSKKKKNKKKKKKNGASASSSQVDLVGDSEEANDTAEINEKVDEIEEIEPPLSNSTADHFDEDSKSLQEEKRNLEEQVNELQESDSKEAEKIDDVEDPISKTPPAIPERSNIAPVLPEREPLPPALPEREHLPPVLPSRDHVAQSAPPLPERDVENGLKPFKNRAASASEFLPPPLPPQLTPAQKNQHRPSTGFANIGAWFGRGSVSKSKTDLSLDNVEYDENYDLLLNRLTENNEDYLSKQGLQKEQLDNSHNELLSTFNEKISEFETSSTTIDESIGDDSEINKIDWPFWTKVFNDYASVAKSEPAKLSKEIAKGIPKQIRSIVWQLVSNANPQEFEEQFNALKLKDLPFEKAIQKDLTRTSYITAYGIDVESLHNVIKVYSLIDPDVGYTQGMAFIAAPLLLDSNELEAFALFHKLMFTYNLRSLYLPEMPGLLLSLYQFDRLVEDTLPNLHTHFLREGVRSSMYATQWFLTFFAYKFPLEFVLRIFDIVITEGFESILKFAIALVSKNEEKLLTLKFDNLIEFLKENLFTAYLIEPEEIIEESNNIGDFFKINKPKPITVDSYNVNQFIEDATNVKLLPITLRRYAEEFEQIHQQEKERQEEVDELKSKNTQLKKEIRKIESSYTILNREHVQIANEIISNRIKVETLEDEVKDLKSQNQVLRDRILSIQKQEVEVPADFESDLKNAMERNLEVMNKNQELEDQVSSLLQEIEELKLQQEEYTKKEEEEKSEEQHHRELPKELQAAKGWTKKFFKG